MAWPPRFPLLAQLLVIACSGSTAALGVHHVAHHAAPHWGHRGVDVEGHHEGHRDPHHEAHHQLPGWSFHRSHHWGPLWDHLHHQAGLRRSEPHGQLERLRSHGRNASGAWADLSVSMACNWTVYYDTDDPAHEPSAYHHHQGEHRDSGLRDRTMAVGCLNQCCQDPQCHGLAMSSHLDDEACYEYAQAPHIVSSAPEPLQDFLAWGVERPKKKSVFVKGNAHPGLSAHAGPSALLVSPRSHKALMGEFDSSSKLHRVKDLHRTHCNWTVHYDKQALGKESDVYELANTNCLEVCCHDPTCKGVEMMSSRHGTCYKFSETPSADASHAPLGDGAALGDGRWLHGKPLRWSAFVKEGVGPMAFEEHRAVVALGHQRRSAGAHRPPAAEHTAMHATGGHAVGAHAAGAHAAGAHAAGAHAAGVHAAGAHHGLRGEPPHRAKERSSGPHKAASEVAVAAKDERGSSHHDAAPQVAAAPSGLVNVSVLQTLFLFFTICALAKFSGAAGKRAGGARGVPDVLQWLAGPSRTNKCVDL